MSVALIVVLTVVVLALVSGLGLLIFRLMRASQEVVPGEADRRAAQSDRVVAVDVQGHEIRESEEAPAAAGRDTAAFDRVLSESLEELHPDGGDPPAESRG